MNGGENQAGLSSNSTIFLDTQNLTVAEDIDPMETNSEQNQAANQYLSNSADHLNEGDSLRGEAITVELGRLEDRIEKGLRAFWDIGQSLGQIRDKQLYRQSYKTFDEYCLNRWEMSRRSAYRLIQAALVYENVTRGSQSFVNVIHGSQNPETITCGSQSFVNVTHGSQNQILPTNERQIRPLVTLPPEKQREAWAKAVSTAPNGKVTADHVAQVAREYHRENSANKSRQKHSFEQQQQSTDNSEQSLNRSCWNCRHSSQELIKDDHQSFYCDRLGKLSFVEKDGNQRGAECEYWTYRFGESSQVRKNVIPLRETFNLTLQLPAQLQPLLQNAAKDSGLTVMDWLTKLVEEKLSHENEKQNTDIDENFVGTVVSEVA
jgi:ribosomal protein L44E